MPEYAKMKNAELEALLKERGLPHAGKKAEMVERLQKDDEKPAVPAASKADHAEDEIDWDDDADEATSAPPAKENEPTGTENAPVAKTTDVSAVSKPQGASDQAADGGAVNSDDPPKQDPADIVDECEEEATTKEKTEPAPDYSIGLAATKLDDEIEKRKKRALKFGTKFEDDESLKKLERAKKFGEVGPPKGLDEALPERTRKRGREEGGENASGHKRRGGGRSSGRGGRGGQDRRDNTNRDDRDGRRDEKRSGSGSHWMNDKDKAAAEARKAKWANAAV